MAKRRRPRKTPLENFAVDLGTVLGTAANKAETWLGQRDAIVKHLTDVRDTASKLLADLGHQAQAVAAGVTGKRRGAAASSKNKKGIIIVGGKTKPPSIVMTKIRTAGSARTHGVTAGSSVRRRRTLSAKGRKAISDAQKARWAKRKAVQK